MNGLSFLGKMLLLSVGGGMCLATSMLVSGCQEKESPSGPSSVASGRGRIFGTDGKPAEGAQVRIVPVEYLPQPALAKSAAGVYIRTADAAGEFDVSGLPAGQYNIIAEKDGQASLNDSVILSGSSSRLPDDTLSAQGSVRGRVRVQPNHEPASVTLQLLGTTVFANVDAEGRFEIGALPRGTYNVRFATTLPDYVALFSGFRIESGKATDIAEPFALAYLGIPIVEGIRVDMDTLRGLARISWHPVKKSDLLGYLVLRDPLNAQSIAGSPINNSRVTDTFYVDTLYGGIGAQGAARGWEYRVMAQTKNGRAGEWFESAALNAVPPVTVKTHLALASDSRFPGQFSLNDTVLFRAAFDNAGRGNRSLAWISGNDTLRKADLHDAGSGEDTLRYVAPNRPSDLRIKLIALDQAGTAWDSSFAYSIVADRPVAHAGRDTIIYPGDIMHLHGQGTDQFGRIVRYEWDIGGTGEFRTVTAGDTSFKVEEQAVVDYPCVLRVTDDDGQTGLDTLWLKIYRFKSEAPRPIAAPLWKPFGVSQPHLAELNGTIYVLGGGAGSAEGGFTSYDTATGVWRVRATAEANGPLYVADGLIWLPLRDGLRAYDPAADAWLAKAPPPVPTAADDRFSAVALGDSLYVLSGSGQWQCYHPARDEWTMHPAPYRTTASPWLARVLPIWNGGPSDLIAFGGRVLGVYPNANETTYDPALNAWTLNGNNIGYWYRHVPAGVVDGDPYVWVHQNLRKTITPSGGIDYQNNWYWPINVADDSLGYDLAFHSIGGSLYSISLDSLPGFLDVGSQPSRAWQIDPAYYKPAVFPVKGTRAASITAGGKIYIMTWYDAPPAGESDYPSWYQLTPF
ncbi:MAG: hypothetical protein JF616_02625 [Fibrobacteres bacterium]|nr:hypothetical protein [Fibrobacterota bacterium]